METQTFPVRITYMSGKTKTQPCDGTQLLKLIQMIRVVGGIDKIEFPYPTKVDNKGDCS